MSERELTAAVAAVSAAAELCHGAQGRLATGDTLVKGDASPVTIADFAAQAVVVATLSAHLGTVAMIGEESSVDLRGDAREPVRDAVVELVRRQFARHPVDAPASARVDTAAVLDWIDVGASSDGTGRFWALDPIDGTKGFLRGDQFAVALALIDSGEVVLGVLGCPNLRNSDGSTGAVFAATPQSCAATYGGRPGFVPVHVLAPDSLAAARLCESVEPDHSDHDLSARIAARLGLRSEPYRIDSQCKYGIVARGEASIYLRLPTRTGYREKVWDHAAGSLVVTGAGGRVTDVTGAPLEFSHGARLEANRGVVATAGAFHAEVVAAVAEVVDR